MHESRGCSAVELQRRALTRSTAGSRPSRSNCNDTESNRQFHSSCCIPWACGWLWYGRGRWGCGNQWRECQRPTRQSQEWGLLQQGGKGIKKTMRISGLCLHSKCLLIKCVTLTYSFLAIGHVRRDDNPSLLSYAQPLQGFVNPSDHIPHADVCVVRAVSLVADGRSIKLRKNILMWAKSTTDQEISSLPRVEGRTILEGSIVVVTDVISSLRPAGAAFRHLLHLHHQIILRVEQINQQHLEHQSRLRRDPSSCQDEE